MCFGVNCPFKKTTLALLHDHSCSSGVKRKGGKEDGCQSLTTASVTAALLTCHHPSVTTAVTSPCHRQSAQHGVPRMSSVSACLCLRWSPSHVLWSLRQWCWLETFSTASKQTNNALHSLRLWAPRPPHHILREQHTHQTAAAHRNISMRSGCFSTEFEQKWCWITSPNS